MDTLQLLLWMGKTYGGWLEKSFPSVSSFADQVDAVLRRLGMPERYLLRLPTRGSERHPDDYARLVLYQPLLQDEVGRRFRQVVFQLGNAPAPNVEIVPFRVNALDVPESLHWYRHTVVLDAAFRWWESGKDEGDYHNTVGDSARDDSILQEAVRLASLSQSQLIRECLQGRPWLDCNSVFLTNLFLYTRDKQALSGWGNFMDASCSQIHNQITALARTRSWTSILRAVLDGDPQETDPFRLVKED